MLRDVPRIEETHARPGERVVGERHARRLGAGVLDAYAAKVRLLAHRSGGRADGGSERTRDLRVGADREVARLAAEDAREVGRAGDDVGAGLGPGRLEYGPARFDLDRVRAGVDGTQVQVAGCPQLQRPAGSSCRRDW